MNAFQVTDPRPDGQEKDDLGTGGVSKQVWTVRNLVGELLPSPGAWSVWTSSTFIMLDESF